MLCCLEVKPYGRFVNLLRRCFAFDIVELCKKGSLSSLQFKFRFPWNLKTDIYHIKKGKTPMSDSNNVEIKEGNITI